MSFGVPFKNYEERILTESYMCFQWGLIEEAYELMCGLIQEVVDDGESIEKTKEIVESTAKFYRPRKGK